MIVVKCMVCGELVCNLEKNRLLPKLPGFKGLGFKGLQKFQFLLQKACSCANPRSIKPFCIKICWGVWPPGWSGKNKESHREAPEEWDVDVNTVLHYHAQCDVHLCRVACNIVGSYMESHTS